MFKEGINLGLFMIKTSIKNLPYKKENDMLWVEDFCSTCGVCIDRCPENAFDDDEKVKRKVCTAHKEVAAIVCFFVLSLNVVMIKLKKDMIEKM